MKTAKKKAGRPQGAKTIDRAVITKQIHRTPCPGCGHVGEPVGKRLLREGPTSNVIDGKQATFYRHYNAKCPKCSKAFVLREFDFAD